MIPITVDPKFLNIDIDLNYLPKKKVVYNIRSNRNLDWLLDIWSKKIFPFNKDQIINIAKAQMVSNLTFLNLL